MNNAADIDAYIAAFTATTQLALQQVREAVKHAAPDAQEVISYGMPAFKMNKVLVYFAGYERHIGFYPGAVAIAAFKNDIARYKSAKGSLQFSLSEQMPLELVKRITAFRLAEDARKKK
ncbi:iron chaperone [Mucilaginibacter glaciei]|uniref:DUF1801 domain-containing protein n=1 Tax=Mucilaginibacter glaciei TaxID=2772109 RepID=A0A926NPL4_9SPHI|nr:DUF1801 domain-containing protein [Mucilaginibacter glaciei]MBD1393586.1 DUF1801 domain-containing protein [Mucilaginibacter glaciei]